MPKGVKDPEMAAAKMKIVASQGSLDKLLSKDPATATDAELRAGVEHLRNERALWNLKQQRQGKNREGVEGDETDGGGE